MPATFDYIIVGGGSAGCILANRLSARSSNSVLLIEAGEDTETRGATGWRWETVLPFFRKIERDVDFDGPLHGSSGYIPVRRVFPNNWSDHAKAVAEACELAGFKYVADQNGEFEDGYYPLAISNLYDRRVSAAIGYLGAVVRQRNNLSILTDTEVCGVLFEDTRCVGIRAMVSRQEIEFRGREVILCCGAIHSPAILLRSGIGPAGQLREFGIPVRAHVPGVGQRLMDHPSISVAAFLQPHARANPYNQHSHLLGMRFSSDLDGAPRGDMAMTITTAFVNRLTVITVWVNKTYSERGQVRLASPDWKEEPQVDFNLLADQRDLKRLMDGLLRIASLHELPPLKMITSDAFPASFTDKVRKVGDVNLNNRLFTLKNKLLTFAGARLLDGPASLRRFMIRNFILEEAGIQRVWQDENHLEEYIRHAAVGVWHCSCSCRMGSKDDPMAVTTPSGQVRAVQGLRVVDASIFPMIPCANTNFPTMMVAEKIADDILTQPSMSLNEP